MQPVVITSTQNPRIKRLLSLQQKAGERRRAGLFVAEGLRELSHCCEGGFVAEEIYFCPSLLQGDAANFLDKWAAEAVWHQVSPEVYGRIAYRGTTEGVVAVIRERKLTLDDLQLRENPLFVVLESVEKPGNLGAVLRSADAAGADAVIVCDLLTDLYNPNLIRSSIGAIFTVPCVACNSEECIRFFKQQHITILTAQLQDSHLYYMVDMKKSTAIVMGTESTGLTDIWRKAADAHIRIPMLGRLDSLNVSVSAAILLFEAVRQRQESP